MKRFLIVSAAAALAALSAGCGLKGKLERPAPMWGPDRKGYIEQQKKEDAAKAAERAAKRPHVDIPVEGANVTTPAAAETSEPQEPADGVDVTQSRGALPPMDDRDPLGTSY